MLASILLHLLLQTTWALGQGSSGNGTASIDLSHPQRSLLQWYFTEIEDESLGRGAANPEMLLLLDRPIGADAALKLGQIYEGLGALNLARDEEQLMKWYIKEVMSHEQSADKWANIIEPAKEVMENGDGDANRRLECWQDCKATTRLGLQPSAGQV